LPGAQGARSTLPGTVDGVAYQASVVDGRVVQFFRLLKP